MPDLLFRVASPSDVPAIVALVESAYRGDSGRKGWTTESDLLDGQRTDRVEVLGLIARPQSQIILAEKRESVGFVACCHIEQKGDACYFGMFSVAPHLQAGGLGKALLAEAERTARHWGASLMRMSVIDVRIDLVAWYERRGYRRTGQKEPFPYGDSRFGVPKRADLRFEVLEKSLSENLVASGGEEGGG